MDEGRRRLTCPDREFVKRQYRDASRLNARIGLHERFSTNPQGLQAWVFDHFDIPEEASILEQELDSQGAIHITKDTGLFVARN